ncbi:MAG: hypothetical protein ABIR62_14765, partial [Dokdonella sp.]|uniref:hypothetical protein n=1 Tax=Dokdonella sp. TaxID=2291710 RepID=UPI00326728F7
MTVLLSFFRRRSGWLRAFAFVAFLALIALGPLHEHTTNERVFAATLVLTTLVLAMFASARVAFPLLLVSLVF